MLKTLAPLALALLIIASHFAHGRPHADESPVVSIIPLNRS